jgi:hypothetical protein
MHPFYVACYIMFSGNLYNILPHFRFVLSTYLLRHSYTNILYTILFYLLFIIKFVLYVSFFRNKQHLYTPTGKVENHYHQNSVVSLLCGIISHFTEETLSNVSASFPATTNSLPLLSHFRFVFLTFFHFHNVQLRGSTDCCLGTRLRNLINEPGRSVTSLTLRVRHCLKYYTFAIPKIGVSHIIVKKFVLIITYVSEMMTC